jgi:DNA-binding transcriptional regulator YiaG
MKNQYTSEILKIGHEDAQGLYELGVIDAARMKEFDEMCLESEPAVAVQAALKPSPTPVYARNRKE